MFLPDTAVNLEFVEMAMQHRKFRGDIVRKALPTFLVARAKLDKQAQQLPRLAIEFRHSVDESRILLGTSNRERRHGKSAEKRCSTG
jgi:hypothetical protein